MPVLQSTVLPSHAVTNTLIVEVPEWTASIVIN